MHNTKSEKIMKNIANSGRILMALVSAGVLATRLSPAQTDDQAKPETTPASETQSQDADANQSGTSTSEGSGGGQGGGLGGGGQNRQIIIRDIEQSSENQPSRVITWLGLAVGE